MHVYYNQKVNTLQPINKIMVKKMKFGVADYGMNVWHGGLYDIEERLKDLKAKKRIDPNADILTQIENYDLRVRSK